jgi:hypothetical protein
LGPRESRAQAEQRRSWDDRDRHPPTATGYQSYVVVEGSKSVQVDEPDLGGIDGYVPVQATIGELMNGSGQPRRGGGVEIATEDDEREASASGDIEP